MLGDTVALISEAVALRMETYSWGIAKPQQVKADELLVSQASNIFEQWS